MSASNFFDAQIRDGMACMQSGDVTGAEQRFRQALEERPDSTDALLLTARCALLKGDPDDAVALLERALTVTAPSPDVHAHCGALLRAAGRPDLARAQFRAALALAPDHLPAMCNLGELLIAADELADALPLLQRAHTLAPADPAATGTLAAGLTRAGHSRQALQLLDSLLARQPDLAAAHITRATALADLGQIDASAEAARLALTHAPNEAAAHWHIALCHFDRGDLRGAALALSAAVQAAPQLASLQAALGVALMLQGDTRGAADAFAGAVRLQPDARHLQEAADFLVQQRESRPANEVASFGFTATHLRHALRHAGTAGLVAEFGVYTGRSIRLIADELGPATEVHGFDSFEGLPESWKVGLDKGSYDAGGALPEVPANVRLHAGWFEDTLPPFLAAHPEAMRFANIDCDIYSSTVTILEQCRERIRAGTVLVFDEFFGYEGWDAHEYRAFMEFIDDTGLGFDYLALSPFSKQATVLIR